MAGNGARRIDPATYDHEATVEKFEETILAVSPVVYDPTQHLTVTIQQLGLEIANKQIELAQIQAKVALVIGAYGTLHIDSWVRQVFREPSMGNADEVLTFEGPLLVPPEDHEALSRFLAAVEELR